MEYDFRLGGHGALFRRQKLQMWRPRLAERSDEFVSEEASSGLPPFALQIPHRLTFKRDPMATERQSHLVQ